MAAGEQVQYSPKHRTQLSFDLPLNLDPFIPGGAADSNCQLHSGDRIVALAQGDSQFVNLQNLSLQDIVAAIRGQPNTTLQLQILPAGADPGSQPTTIAITRNQIKFKQ